MPYRWFRQAGAERVDGRSAVCWSLALSLVWVAVACRVDSPTIERPTCIDRMKASELPADLCIAQRGLTSLRLPDSVDSLEWLRGSRLRTLHVDGAGELERVDDLPVSLRTLSLRGSGVTSLRLPQNLTNLDVTDSPVRSLVGLPAGLRRLALSEIDPRELASLPPKLTHLELKYSTPGLILGDLKQLPELEELGTLVLRGDGIVSLEGMPPSVVHLRLRVTQLPLADLSEDLRTLVLDVGGPFHVARFPPYLDQLTLDSWQPADSIDSVTPFLSRLEARDVDFVQLDALPRSLEELALFGRDLAQPPELPPNLKRLHLLASKLDAEKLAGLRDLAALESLALFNFPQTGLPELPAGLRDLDLTWSQVRRLDADLENLRLLNLTGVELAPGERLPRTLRGLVWQARPSHPLPPIPGSVECLDLSGSSSLTSLPELPRELTLLLLAKTGLTSLPANLPPSLRVLDVSNSPLRVASENLPDSLEVLIVSPGQLESLGDTTLQRLDFLLPEAPFAEIRPADPCLDPEVEDWLRP